jgi:hypothetical protein
MNESHPYPPSTTGRSWLSFRLRTLLVLVTVVGLVLGWELKFVRERQAWKRSHAALIRQIEPVPVGTETKTGVAVLAHATASGVPFWRRWLGDAPVSSIVLPEGATDHKNVQRLFPEAELGEMVTFR